MIEGLDIGSIFQMLPKIKETISKAKEFLPKVAEYEKTILTSDEAKENCKVVYTAMLTNERVFLYVFVMSEKEGDTIVKRQVKKIDLLPLLEAPETMLLSLLG